MDVYEELSYLPRLAVILFSTVIIVLIFAFAKPTLPSTAHLQADVYAGVVANNGGFWQQAGVADPDRFTQRVADTRLVSEHEQTIPIYIAATLEYEGDTRGPIIYNTAAHEILDPLVDAIGIEPRVWRLPVAVATDDGTVPGVLVMEAYWDE